MSKTSFNTIFFGTPDFAVPVLQTLHNLEFIKITSAVTQPDKPVGKKQVITPPPVKIEAEKNNLTVLQPISIKTKEFEQIIRQQKPDLAIIIAYGKIIPANLLEISKFGWLNIHASLLPKYRGASPIQGSILNGESQTGVTLMKIDQGLDTGSIISQKEIPIEPTDNFQTLHEKLARLGAELIKESLLDYLNGKLKLIPQNNNQASATKIIKKQDGQINWANPAEYIERQIRAYTSWPGTFCFWGESRLKILNAEVNMLPKNLKPGEVFIHGKAIIIGTGKNGLKITKIQLAGKKPTNIQEFIKGYPEIITSTLK